MQESGQNTKVAMLGSGNMSTHLSLALQQNGFEIVQIFGRNTVAIAELSQKLNNCATTTTIKNIVKDADIYILALSDEGVVSVAKNLIFGNKIVIHCAGSLPMDILQNTSANYGVFYPLFTFSKNIPVNFSNIPICIEASNDTTGNVLMGIAKSLSTKTEWISSEKRKLLHLSAVFTCNFLNLLNTAAYEILESANLHFSLLRPLIDETLRKTEQGNPFQYQTGPAVRNDQKVIQEQLALLEKFPEYRKIYEDFSVIIQKKKNAEGKEKL